MKFSKKDPIIKNLSTLKWSNPNNFNAIDGVIAFIVAIVGFFALQFAISPLFNLLSDIGATDGLLMCVSALITQGFIILVAFIFCKIRNVKLFGGDEIGYKFHIPSCLPAIALLFGTFMLIYPVHYLYAENISVVQEFLFGKNAFTDSSFAFSEEDMIFGLLYVYVLVPILPAICEEALFRGVIMSAFKEFGSLFAIFASGFLFAIMHGSHVQFILQFICGCEIAFVVLITGNYFVGTIMHFVNNSFIVIFYAIITLLKLETKVVGGLIEGLSILIGIAALIFAICYYVKLFGFKSNKREAARNGVKFDDEFKFYKNVEKTGWCCLLQKGNDVSCNFAEKEYFVRSNNNSNFLYFYKGKFRPFTKKSNRKLFKILFIIAITLGIAYTIFNFIV